MCVAYIFLIIPLVFNCHESLGYLPPVEKLLILDEKEKVKLDGHFAHEMTRIMKYDRHLQTDRNVSMTHRIYETHMFR